MILTIDQQIARMAEIGPSWSVRRLSGAGAEWSGALRPNRVEYRLRVRYRVWPVLANVTAHDIQPRVYVDSPALVRQPGNPEGDLPHVYWPRGDVNGEPMLCLFDADGREWSSSDYLADTTVPWSAYWLNWYEGWRITSVWLGSDRHNRTTAGGDHEPKRLENEEVGRDAA